MKKLLITSSLLLFFLQLSIEAYARDCENGPAPVGCYCAGDFVRCPPKPRPQQAIIEGYSAKHIDESDSCMYSDIVITAKQEAHSRCIRAYANAKVFEFTVTKEWDAMIRKYRRDDTPYYLHQCIIDWKVICKSE